jgi:hypothetical protein
MKKLILTLTLAGINTALYSQSYGHEENNTGAYLLGGVFGITLWIIILWQVINSASRANRLVKINLLQLELQLREHNARTGETLTLVEFAKELPRLNKEIKKADLDTIGDEK